MPLDKRRCFRWCLSALLMKGHISFKIQALNKQQSLTNPIPHHQRNDLKDGGRGLIWPQTRNAASVMSDVDAVRVFTRCCFPASSTITRHRHTSQTRPTTRPLQASTLLRNNHSAHLKCVGQAPERCGSGSESRRTPSLTPESPLHSHHPRKHRVQSEEHSDVCR